MQQPPPLNDRKELDVNIKAKQQIYVTPNCIQNTECPERFELFENGSPTLTSSVCPIRSGFKLFLIFEQIRCLYALCTTVLFYISCSLCEEKNLKADCVWSLTRTFVRTFENKSSVTAYCWRV